MESAPDIDHGNIRIYANGNIGCYGHPVEKTQESVYTTQVEYGFKAIRVDNNSTRTFNKGETIYPFVTSIGKTKTQY